VQAGLPVDRDDDANEDWGLNYPFSYSWRAYTRYYHSNFVALPDEGGLGDQDELLMDDLDTLSARVDRQMRRLRKQEDAGGLGYADGTLEEIDLYA
jgi:hypothetical protein